MLHKDTPKHETRVPCVGRVSTRHGRLKSTLRHAILVGCGRCFTLNKRSTEESRFNVANQELSGVLAVFTKRRGLTRTALIKEHHTVMCRIKKTGGVPATVQHQDHRAKKSMGMPCGLPHSFCERVCRLSICIRDAEITNIPFSAALTGALRRFNPLV